MNPSSKPIVVLPKQKSNHSINLAQPQFLALYPDYEMAKTIYYPYNHEYDDFGWGCAWRAIKTMLHSQFHDKGESQIENILNFKALVQKYQKKNILVPLLEKYKNIPINEDIRCGKWAPQENQNCWAEPFICKLICKDYKLDTHLILVNGYPKAYAPEAVFQQVLTFSQFCTNFIMKYLPESPIMIDDGQLALSIVGYRLGTDEQIHLILADPHISSNRADHNSKQMQTVRQLQNTKQQQLRYKKNTLYKYIGIYEVVLDKNGAQVSNSVDAIQDFFYPMSSYSKIFFNQKKWMAVAITKN